MEWTVGFVVLLIGFVASVYQIGGGPPWPTDPTVSAQNSVDGSSLILPFTIENKSAFFPIDNVRFRCGVDLIWAADSRGKTIIIRDAAFANGVYSLEAGSKPINYDCDASDILKLRQDGSLSLFGSSTVLEDSQQADYKPPWQILKMCIWIGGQYRIAGLFRHTFTSDIFQWPAVQGENVWLDGPVIESPGKEQTLPGMVPDALTCSNSVRYPYVFVDDPGQARIVFK